MNDDKVSKSRMQELAEWAHANYEVAKHAKEEPSIILGDVTESEIVEYYRAYIYTHLCRGAVESNRTDDSKWEFIERGMVSWQDFLRADPSLEKFRTILNIGFKGFYRNRHALVWRPDDNMIEIVDSLLLSDVDGYGIYIAHQVLGFTQNAKVSNADLSGIRYEYSTSNARSQTVPSFEPGIYEYHVTATAPRLTIIGELGYKYQMTPRGLSQTSSELEINESEDLEIVVVSQDKYVTNKYVFHVTRVSE